jgi:hypothetical protein
MSRLHLSLLLSTAFAAGCASSGEGPQAPTEGHAFLTIVGESDMYVDGARKELLVQYHDDQGRPLAGEVAFDIAGDPRGGDLSATTSVTDGEGLARIEVIAGEETTFTVQGSALYAEPVTWTIEIGPGGWALDATGDYELESDFDLVDGVPGPVGDVVNALLDATDDPTDPSTWVIDAILTAIDNQAISDAIGGMRPQLDVILNQVLLASSPDFVPTIIEVGDDLGQVARHFGAFSTLSVGRDIDRGLLATHTIDSFVFTIDGEPHEYTLDELEHGESRAEQIKLRLRGQTKLGIDNHELPVAYGHLLVFVLDHAIIPAIDPDASNLGELLVELVDCAAVGERLSDEIGIGPPIVYELACKAGLAVVGTAIEDQLSRLDATTRLVIGGDARPQDVNSDDTIDRLVSGEWEGELRFSPDIATALSRPEQEFTGSRL